VQGLVGSPKKADQNTNANDYPMAMAA